VTMSSASGPGLGKYREVWAIICGYLQYRQPADLQGLSFTCSSISPAARSSTFQSLIVGPSSSAFFAALSHAKEVPVPVLSYIHTLHLITVSPGEPEENDQKIQSRLASCLHHLPQLSRFSIECRHIIPLMLESLSHQASLRPIDFALSGGANFTKLLMPNGTLRFSGLSFTRNPRVWSSLSADTQVVNDLISRSVDTLTSLRVDDGHVDCLKGLANQPVELPHLHNLVVLPTYTGLESRFALRAALAQLKVLRDEPDSCIDILLCNYPSIEELSLTSPSVVPRCLPSTALPNLRKITGDSGALCLLVPGRPVTTVILTAPWPMTTGNEQVSELDEDERAEIWEDRRQLEELAMQEQEEVFRCAYALSYSTGPIRRLTLPLVRPANWHTKLAKHALAAFVEAVPTVEYLTVRLDPMVRAKGLPLPASC
jgi:hypothetical protein